MHETSHFHWTFIKSHHVPFQLYRLGLIHDVNEAITLIPVAGNALNGVFATPPCHSIEAVAVLKPPVNFIFFRG